MATSPKREEEPDQTATSDIPSATESATPKESKSAKGSKSKSHSRDVDSKDSPGSASAKRRCVSTACIACRRRKSKVRYLARQHMRAQSTRLVLYACDCCDADNWLAIYSVTATHQAVLLAPPSTVQIASTIPTRITGGRAFIRKTSTISRPETPPYKH